MLKGESGNHLKIGGSTFMVRILFRQNASWQGELHWLEQDKKCSFRSLLELVTLIQAAVDEAKVPKSECQLRGW
ncbi:MAG: hypothetical protein ACOYBM_02655 [Dethiobacteria bacterium]|jgi:hypothetical protein